MLKKSSPLIYGIWHMANSFTMSYMLFAILQLLIIKKTICQKF